jgi:DNA-binding NarL/FixJ family response regulator
LLASSRTDDGLLRLEVIVAALEVEAMAADAGRTGRTVTTLDEVADRAEALVVEARTLTRGLESGASAPGRRAALMATAEAYTGSIGRLDEATRWAAAADAWEQARAPLETAHAMFRESNARLTSHGDRELARTRLAAARGIATDLGAALLLGEIGALAVRARMELDAPRHAGPPPEPTAAERLGLSERELEVLLLVERGMTNRQIAETLFITEKTAGHHVSHILDKLGVASRVEAAGVAHRAGMAAE